MSCLNAAELILSRGWRPIPVPYRAKGPVIDGWPELRLTLDDLPQHFNGRSNIGVLCGEPSGGLIDIDLDCDEAMALASDYLPKTGMIHGRRTRQRSHYWFKSSIGKTKGYTDGEAKKIIELRSTGTQTLLPPSVHPEGDVYQWDAEGDPAEVMADTLLDAVGILAACTVLARAWPGKDSRIRNTLALAVAGMLLRGNRDEGFVAKFIMNAARVADDEEWPERGKIVENTARKLQDGDPATGGPTASELIGDKATAKIREYLGLAVERESDLPKLDAGEGDLAKISDLAWTALHAVNDPPRIFRKSMQPVHIKMDESGSPVIRRIEPEEVRDFVARCAQWVVRRRVGKKTVEVPARPPMDVIRNMLAIFDLPLRPLHRIVEAPYYDCEGVLHREPGYHHGLIYVPAPGFDILSIPANPSDQEFQLSRDIILGDLLGDFPFTGDAERAHSVALLLLPYVREMIPGPTPGHLLEKPTPGTGASLMAEVLMYPALGRWPKSMTEGRDEDENRKRLTAKLHTGPSVVLIDNLERILDSSSLASIIVSGQYEDRLLGKTEMVTGIARPVWIFTGNNPELGAQMARRVVRIRIDARTEFPWERTDFRHQKLKRWVQEHRARIVCACLVFIQRWITAGKPLLSDKHKTKPQLGSFEDWRAVMGGILEVCDIKGFLENQREVYRESDRKGKGWRAFVERWWAKHEDQPVGTKELFRLIVPLTDQEDGIDLGLKDGTDRSLQTQLGKALAKHKQRVFAGYRIVEAGSDNNRHLWKLERAA